MSWLIQSLVEVLMDKVLKPLFLLLTTAFLQDMQFDIGAPLHMTTSFRYDISYAIERVGEIADIPQDKRSLFDNVFGQGLSQFTFVIMLTAVVFATIIAFFQIYKAIINPEEAENPIKSVIRYAGTLVAVACSYHIFVVFEYMFNRLYMQFLSVALSASVTTDVSLDSDGETLTNMFNLIQYPTGQLAEENHGVWNTIVKVLFTGGVGATTSSGHTGMDLLAPLIEVIILFAIIINFFKLLLEVIERYLILGVMFYFAPLPFATLASKNTSSVFSAWVRMAFSQVIVMLSSCIFLSVFLGALGIYGGGGLWGSEKAVTFTSANQYLLYMFMLVAWLILGQRIDGHLKGLGLNTAQSGSNLLGAAAGVFGVTRMISLGKDISRGIERHNEKMAKATEAATKAKSQTLPAGTSDIGDAKRMNNLVSDNMGLKNANLKNIESGRATVDTQGKTIGTSTVMDDKSVLHTGVHAQEKARELGQSNRLQTIGGVPVFVEGTSDSKATGAAVAMNKASRDANGYNWANNQKQELRTKDGHYTVATSGGEATDYKSKITLTDQDGNVVTGTAVKMEGQNGQELWNTSNGQKPLDILEEGRDYSIGTLGDGTKVAIIPDANQEFEGVKGFSSDDGEGSRFNPDDDTYFKEGYKEAVENAMDDDFAKALTTGESASDDAFENVAKTVDSGPNVLNITSEMPPDEQAVFGNEAGASNQVSTPAQASSTEDTTNGKIISFNEASATRDAEDFIEGRSADAQMYYSGLETGIKSADALIEAMPGEKKEPERQAIRDALRADDYSQMAQIRSDIAAGSYTTHQELSGLTDNEQMAFAAYEQKYDYASSRMELLNSNGISRNDQYYKLVEKDLKDAYNGMNDVVQIAKTREVETIKRDPFYNGQFVTDEGKKGAYKETNKKFGQFMGRWQNPEGDQKKRKK